MQEPTIVLQFKSDKTLEMLPDVYIRSFEDSIKANCDNNVKLEEVRRKLIDLRALVDAYQAKIWAKSNGFQYKSREF